MILHHAMHLSWGDKRRIVRYDCYLVHVICCKVFPIMRVPWLSPTIAENSFSLFWQVRTFHYLWEHSIFFSVLHPFTHCEYKTWELMIHEAEFDYLLHAWVCPKGRLMAASHYKAYLLKPLSFCFNRGWSILDWTSISEKGKTD